MRTLLANAQPLLRTVLSAVLAVMMLTLAALLAASPT